MKLLFLIMYLLSFSVFGESFTHQLKGKFSINGTTTSTVSFVLRWSEVSGKISGNYADNLFTRSAKVSGNKDRFGRSFLVNLVEQKKGIRSISIITSNASLERSATALPLSIITRDTQGNPLTTTKINANFVALMEARDRPVRLVQREEARPCTRDFGDLAGFCGRYGGLVAEGLDALDACNLLKGDTFRLEINERRNVLARLNWVTRGVLTPTHVIGTIPKNHAGRSIEITSRTCGRLPGTTFDTDLKSCKRLSIVGRFSEERGTHHFVGTYTIYDERSRGVCRYDLSLDKNVDGL